MKPKFLFLAFVIIALTVLAVTIITRSGEVERLNELEVVTETSVIETKPNPHVKEVPINPNRKFKSLDSLIAFELARILGREAGFEETYRRENNQWLVLCGKPLELNGASFNYLNSSMKRMAEDNLMEDNACFLSEKKSGDYLLRGADIGALDSPILAWVERYELPIDLLKN